MVSVEDPRDAAADGVEHGLELVGLLGQDAEVGSQLEDAAGLAQDRPGAAGVVQRQVGPGHLQQRLHRHAGDRVGEQRPQASGLDKVLFGPGQVAVVQGHPGGHGVDQGAHDVVVEVPGLTAIARACSARASASCHCWRSIAMMARSARAVEAAGKAPVSRAHLDRVGQDRICLVGVAVEQVGDTLQQQRRRPPRASPGSARPARPARRPASGPCRCGTAARRASPGSSPSCCRLAAPPRPGHGPRRRPAFGGVCPAFGPRRPAHQRLQPGPEHRHRRVRGRPAPGPRTTPTSGRAVSTRPPA